MNGLLLVDKPKNWTSFDVVAKVRGQIRRETDQKSAGQRTKVKVGHTGTLDPLATGLLVLTLGTYCKRAQEFSKLDKTYEVTMKLGETSTTGDEEGEKSPGSAVRVARSEIETALEQFTGEIMQTPPIYSAIKVDGQRAYKLARAGKEVKLEPRPVKIHKLQVTSYKYPYVKFTADVSSGTYIRSLVEDIGTTLGTGAYMSDLRRTKVGNFELKNAVNPQDIDLQDLQKSVIFEP